MSKLTIIKSILFSISLFQSMLFIPDNIFKGYNIVGYSTILGMFLMLTFIKSSMENSLIVMLKQFGMYLSVIAPVSILLYTSIRYKKVIEEDATNVENYRTLKVITTILLLIQTYILANYILTKNISMNQSITLLMFSILNIFVSGLLWREVAFFVTDG